MKLISSILAMTLFGTTAYSGSISGSRFDLGAWYGQAYYSEETGKWSHCTVTAEYPNGFNLTFSLNDDYQLGLYLISRDKEVFEGTDGFEVVTQVDNFEPMFGTGYPIDQFAAGVWYEDLDKAIYQFKKGRTLTVSSRLGITKFGLKGTFKALNAAYSCASNYQKFKVANFEPRSEGFSDEDWIPSAAEVNSMYQLATLLISDFNLKDFKYTAASDTTKAGPVIFWANQDTLQGMVAVGRVKGPEIDLNGIMAEDVASLTAKYCTDGDIAVVNSTTNIDGVTTKSLKAICNSEKEPFTAYVTKQVIAEKLIEIILMDYGKERLSGSHKDTVTENVGYISAKLVTYD